MATDDARIVDASACQLETWIRKDRQSIERWALPACNFTGGLEITLGGARMSDEEGARATDVVFQGKTLFRALSPGGWSWGLVAGAVRRRPGDPDASRSSDLYAYSPASFSFRDDRIVLHTNLGWLREGQSSRHLATWGAGSELLLGTRTWLIAEVFGRSHAKPLYQAGLRHWLAPDRVQIDVTFGSRIGNGAQERWFTIGLRLISEPFLP